MSGDVLQETKANHALSKGERTAVYYMGPSVPRLKPINSSLMSVAKDVNEKGLFIKE